MVKQDIETLKELSEPMLRRLLKAVACSSDSPVNILFERLIKRRVQLDIQEFTVIETILNNQKHIRKMEDHVSNRLFQFDAMYGDTKHV